MAAPSPGMATTAAETPTEAVVEPEMATGLPAMADVKDVALLANSWSGPVGAFEVGGRVVAVKGFPIYTVDARIEAEVEQALRLTNNVPHTSLARMLDIHRSDAALFVRMEYVPGPSLTELLKVHVERHAREGRKGLGLPINVVQFLASCLVCAVQRLHEQGVLLRTWSLASVRLDSKGYPVICNLRSCGKVGDEIAAEMVWRHVKGAAPEVLRSVLGKPEACSTAVDFWGLGCVVFELLTGRLPFGKFESPRDCLIAARNGSPDLGVVFKASAQNLCSRLLAFDPEKRSVFRGADEAEQGIGRVRGHSFFVDVHWDLIEARRVVSPLLLVAREKRQLHFKTRAFASALE